MNVWFVFSDETGEYKTLRDVQDEKRYPYYLRASILLPINTWRYLDSQGRAKRKLFDLPVDREIKWSYLWSLFKHEKAGEPVPEDKDYKFLERHGYETLLSYAQEFLGVLDDLDSAAIIVSITSNAHVGAINERRLLEMHVQDLMQRVQMHLARDDLAVALFDPVSSDTNCAIEAEYARLYREGDFIAHYDRVKDTVAFETSSYSVGIQFADFVVGVCHGMLRGYKFSQKMFFYHVYPKIRKGPGDDAFGYGIVEVPTDSEVREHLQLRVDEALTEYAPPF